MSYYYSRKFDWSFKDAIEKVTAALREEGFGILTEIDVKETLLEKAGYRFSQLQDFWSL